MGTHPIFESDFDCLTERANFDNRMEIEADLVRTFILCVSILLVKMMVLQVMTSRQRIKHGKFANKEDAALAGSKPTTQYDLKRSLESNDDIERIRRAHLNDMENIYPFVFLGILALVNHLPNCALHFVTFTAARLAHTVVYLLGIRQPARAVCFSVGLIANLSLALQLLI